ncbi:hypothetical protein [Halomonas marinisediminis]|uniref:Uncharacterized protein n=1 Tax=Halomonas marinisediminis TaxID=2546095 RepID=A0ABY2DB99_9GAMM|nr:hypothetical protein [Halomonas marinisediminis]TDB05603.1 hypothetical protein E0702_01155 [Halomonas marinisediminis]
MKVRIRSYRRIRAVGSVMDFWPTSNYVEHMPKGTPQQRLGQYWQNVGNQICKSIKDYEQLSHER